MNIYELKTEFRYKLRISMVIYDGYDNVDYVNLNITPDFDGYNRNIADDCVVISVYELLDTLTRNVIYDLLTCECGQADDVGIEGPITSTISGNTVTWEMSIKDYQEILDKPYSELTEGILRLIFDKTQYTQAVHQLIRELKTFIKQGIPTATLTAEDFTRTYYTAKKFLPELAGKYSHLNYLNIGQIAPDDDNLLKFILEYPLD